MKTRNLIGSMSVFLTLGLAQAALAGSDLELIYSGPVESFNAPSGVYSVLGHQIPASERSTADVGSLVNVYGKLLPNGELKSAIVERVSDYTGQTQSI